MKLNAPSHRWQMTALAAAAAAVMGLAAPSALALSLGRITVQSALGEPLRAEIEVPELSFDEAASLKTSVALPDAFRAAGLEYNAAMTSMQLSLQRRPDGRAFIRVASDRAINDPFVDMIIEASWASGRVVRDYTVLLDPRNMRAPASAPPAPTPAQTSPAPAPQPEPVQKMPPVEASPAPVPPPVPSRVIPAPPQPTPTPVAPPPKVAVAAPKATTADTQQIRVRSGDTAGKIASANKPANVSLDQMLVALLRANPEAFINDNVNRVKTGAVLNLPSAEQAQEVSPAEASRTILAQSQDFNAFRRKLADIAPVTHMAAADRQASGSIKAKVEEKKPTTAPDKLTLSKGAMDAKQAADTIAKEKQAKETAHRAAELDKNIKELSKLSAATSVPVAVPPAAPPTPPTAAVAPKASAPVSSPAVVAAPVVAPAASAPMAPASAPVEAASAPDAAVASAPAAPASAASAPAPIAKPVAPPPVVAESSFLDDLLENPLLAPAGAGLLALLAGLGVYRLRQRKKAQADNAAPDSSLQSDSFFDANGGQQVNTNEADSTGSAMVFSPSQVDAPENVDPVAEADVYLTYGRDQQAEEILRAALKTHGERLAIHQKLLEIYAKRRDTEHFEEIATLAYDLTGGTGPDWERYCDMGLAIDPTNPLYQPGGQPGNGENPDRAALEAMRNEEIGAPMPAEAPPPVATTDLDLDLDFSLDEAAPSASIEANSGDYGDSEATLVMQAPPPEPAALSADEPPPHEEPALSMDFGSLPELDLPPAPVAPPPAPVEAVSTPADSGMLEFDLGSLSLDLGTEPEVPTEAPPPQEDPLVTKLDLAQEFVAIGDEDGARALIEEVIAESTGDMKLKAQRALSALS